MAYKRFVEKQERRDRKKKHSAKYHPDRFTHHKAVMIEEELAKRPRAKSRNIPHKGDFKNYAISNMFAWKGIKPSRRIDRDQDGIIDVEDCAPNDPRRQGWLSNVGKAIGSVANKVATTVTNTVTNVAKAVGNEASKVYTNVDKAVFNGALPGGAPSPSQSSSSSSPSSSNKSSGSSGGSSGGSSSSNSGGGGGRNSNPFNLPQTSNPFVDNANINMSSIPTSTSVNTGTKQVGNAIYKTYTDLATGKSFIGEQVSVISGTGASAPKSAQQQQQDWVRKQNSDDYIQANKVEGAVVSAYKPFTRAEQEQSAKLMKEYNKSQFWSGMKEKFEEYTAPIGDLFAGIDYIFVGANADAHKEAEDKEAKYGHDVYKDMLPENKYDAMSQRGTRQLLEHHTATDEELAKMKYGGTEVMIDRQVQKSQEEINSKIQQAQDLASETIKKQATDYANNVAIPKWTDYAKKTGDYQTANVHLQAEVQDYANGLSGEANKKIEEQVKPLIDTKNKEIKDYADKVVKDKTRAQAKSEVVQRALEGVALGAGIVLTGGVGAVVGGIQTARTVADGGNIIKSFKNDPTTFVLQNAPLTIGMIAGAGIGGKIAGNPSREVVKVMKSPEELKMVGGVEYLRNLKYNQLPKIEEIEGIGGNAKAIVKGGSVEQELLNKGYTQAVRTGENWKEVIVQSPTGEVLSAVTREFNGKRYIIKTSIDELGNRVTEVYRGSKKLWTGKDTVQSHYGLTEALEKFNLEMKGRVDLPNKKIFDATIKDKLSTSEFMNKVKGTYKVNGKLVDEAGSLQTNVVSPLGKTQILEMFRQTGDTRYLKLLKQTDIEKAIISDEATGGTNKNFRIEKMNVKMSPEEMLQLKGIQEIKTPDVATKIEQFRETNFEVNYAKYPSKTKVAMEKLIESQRKLLADKRGELRLENPELLEKTKIAIDEIKLKTDELKLAKGFERMIELPREIGLTDLRYLMMLGALESVGLMKTLQAKNKLVVRKVQIPAMKLMSAQVQQIAQATQLKQDEVQIQKNQENFKEPEVPVPEVPLPPFVIKTPLPLTGLDNDKGQYGRSAQARKNMDSRLVWTDPLFALTGKNRYTRKMNIDLTRRYGNFST